MAQDFTVIAFIDANANGAFDPGLEPQIGSTRVETDLPIGASSEVGTGVRADDLPRRARCLPGRCRK